MPSIDDSKCILITGATSGIGRALALALAKLPSRPQVIAAGRRKERLEELSKIEGIYGVPLNLDTDLDTLKKSVEDLISRFPDVSFFFPCSFRMFSSIAFNRRLTSLLTVGHCHFECRDPARDILQEA